MLLLAAFLACALSPEQASLPDLLSRVAEEAEMLQQNAPKSLSLEVLEQRALMPVTRFRPRIGKKAIAVAPPPRRWPSCRCAGESASPASELVALKPPGSMTWEHSAGAFQPPRRLWREDRGGSLARG